MTNYSYSALCTVLLLLLKIINNHCYKSYLPLGVASYWLFRNNAQKLGT